MTSDNEKNSEETLSQRLNKGVAGGDNDPGEPGDDIVLAYLGGSATARQKAQVQAALERSSSFRQRMIELARVEEEAEIDSSDRGVQQEFDAALRQPTQLPGEIRRLITLGTQHTNRIVESGVHAEASDSRKSGLLAWLSGQRPALAMAAAGLVAAVLAYPAYLGLVQGPALNRELQLARGELERLQASIVAPDGTIDVISLTNYGVRDTEFETIEVPTPEETKNFAFAAMPSVVDDVSDDAIWSFEIYSGQQRYWSNEISSRDIRQALNSNSRPGMYFFMVPRATLPPGDYQMKISVDAKLLDAETVEFTVIQP